MRAYEFLTESRKCPSCEGMGNIQSETCHECSGVGTMHFIEETAGVGTLTKQNTTVDVKKGTLKKQGKAFGFDITDKGIPPKISKDSANT